MITGNFIFLNLQFKSYQLSKAELLITTACVCLWTETPKKYPTAFVAVIDIVQLTYAQKFMDFRNANMFGFPDEHMNNSHEINTFISSKCVILTVK